MIRLGPSEEEHEQGVDSLLVLDRLEQRLGRRLKLGKNLRVGLGLKRLDDGREDLDESSTEGVSGDGDEGSECSSVEGRDGEGDEGRDDDGEDRVGPDGHDLFEGSESGLGRLSRLSESLEKGGDGLVDGLGSELSLLHLVEGSSSGSSHGRVLVDEGSPDRGNDDVLVLLELKRSGALPGR